MRVLITRPDRDAAGLAAELGRRGHEAISAPLLTIAPLPAPADLEARVRACQAILLTSANGARALAGATALRSRPVYAVGQATAAAAEGHGFSTVFSADGDAPALDVQLSALAHRHPADALVAELRGSLPSRVGRPPRERAAIWIAIEDALAPERCLAESLNASCVAPAGLAAWLMPLRAGFDLADPVVLREPAGGVIGWQIRGCRKAN